MGTLLFSRTSGWATDSRDFVLSEGPHTVKLLVVQDHAGPNIDALRIIPAPVYEAEHAEISPGNGEVEGCSGCSGQQQVDMGNRGSYLEWTVDIARSGIYKVVFKYSQHKGKRIQVRIRLASKSHPDHLWTILQRTKDQRIST